MAGLKPLVVIIIGGVLMAMIALVGGLTALLPARRQEQLLLPLISLAAGSLLGGSLFHMLPQGIGAMDPRWVGLWLAAGFWAFLALEQGLHWHHSHRHPSPSSQPVTLLILVGDALHNFIGGLGIASTYLINPAAGLAAWLAAAAHELPQELGDYGVLRHAGWSRQRALRWNVLSALTFPLGGVVAWWCSGVLPLPGLVLFAAGNFLYIAASDLVPEIKARSSLGEALIGFAAFTSGLLLLLLLAAGES